MKKLLFLILLTSVAQASFDSTSFRYLSGHEIPAKLSSAFVKAFHVSGISACNITKTYNAATGIISPDTGRTLYAEPGTAFINWYMPCLKSAIDTEFKMTANESYETHLGPLLEKAKLGQNSGITIPYKVPVITFSEDDFKALVKYQVERLLGPDEVIEEMGFVESAEKLREDLLQELRPLIAMRLIDVEIVLRKLEIEILSRDEFLVY